MTTLIFPDTIVTRPIAAQLLMFFEKIYHYLPAEPMPSAKAGPPPAADPYAEAGLCLGYPPVPVGEGLERFWNTIRDLRANASDYGHRLPHLALASQGLPDRADRDEKTVSALVGRLQAGQMTGRPAEAGADLAAELWKARIVLKLAEGLDAIEQEVEQELAGLDAREQEMLAALKGQEEEPEEEVLAADDGAIIPERSAPGPSRIKAWARLFLAEQAAGTAPADPWLATTANPEAAQLLLDAYASRSKQEPARLFALPLPRVQQTAAVELAKRAAFLDAVAGPRLALHKFLLQSATGEKLPPASTDRETAVAEAITGWRAALGDHVGDFGPPQDCLVFYCLPQLSLPALFALVSPSASLGHPPARACRCGIIGVLEKGNSTTEYTDHTE